MTTLGMLQCSVAGVGFPRELSTIKSLIAKPLQSSVSQNYPSQWTDLDGVKRLAKNHELKKFFSFETSWQEPPVQVIQTSPSSLSSFLYWISSGQSHLPSPVCLTFQAC